MGIMTNIEAILFDVDGTLLDTAEFVYQACEYTLQFHGLPLRPRTELTSLMGMPLEGWYRHLAPYRDAAPLCETHRSFQGNNLHLSAPFPHAQETVIALKRAGIKIAAVTTRSKRTSLMTLEAGGILRYCDVVVSGEDTERPKPHPEPLLKALHQLQLEPVKAIMVGDTEADILAGKHAGTRTIGATYGCYGVGIAASDPDFLIADIQEIIPLVLS